MAGSCRKKDKGKTGVCKLCEAKFIMDRTFVLCPQCSLIIGRKASTQLSKEERRLKSQYFKPYNRIYQKSHPDKFLMHAKRWKEKNPTKKRLQRARGTRRYNEETLEFATNRYSRWGSDEVGYIKENKERKTAREIAMDLGRTYCAVMVRACREKIPLMTEDKRHGRLVTK